MSDTVKMGMIWGALTPSPAVDEGDGWLRCEVALDTTTKGTAVPTLAHMAQATLIRKGFAKFVVTTNLDGLYRKAGLKAPEEVCFLHGDTYPSVALVAGMTLRGTFPYAIRVCMFMIIMLEHVANVEVKPLQ